MSKSQLIQMNLFDGTMICEKQNQLNNTDENQFNIKTQYIFGQKLNYSIFNLMSIYSMFRVAACSIQLTMTGVVNL